ncbi:MAG: hypothetical protein HN842_05595 [Gammaproteobacteria bacterium]|jgi:hypothetical protein|nr:hypothetical protein [Gammaproteobacteria bacterium]
MSALSQFLQQQPVSLQAERVAEIQAEMRALRVNDKEPPSSAQAASWLHLYQQLLPHMEKWLHHNLNPERLSLYQTFFRELEGWYSTTDAPNTEDQNTTEKRRHHFTIVIPVADRPQQLQQCLHSLQTLCQTYQYGGTTENSYPMVTVLIADDSNRPDSITKIQQLGHQLNQSGLECLYFGLSEQQSIVEEIPPSLHHDLHRTLSELNPIHTHKGASATRNLALLKLMALQQQHPERRALFWFVDSDQEFQVTVEDQPDPLYCINYLYQLDQLFQRRTETVMVTGKLVGDPPVSPTVMASNLLLDLNTFLTQLAEQEADQPCQFHQAEAHQQGEAAYHDMTDLFGYAPPSSPYRYLCDLKGEHNHSHCLSRFAERLSLFFYGEHPTRHTHFQPGEQTLFESCQPARTVYTANYVMTYSGVDAFLPFASLKLRMAGPALGRLLQQRLGKRFLSANLPMLHKRTLEGLGRAEHRPGVDATPSHSEQKIDLSVEFERQFYGDVLLFSLEPLIQSGFPEQPLSETVVQQQLAKSEQRLRRRYSQLSTEIESRLETFTHLCARKQQWWNQSRHPALPLIDPFIENIRSNFLAEASVWRKINSDKHRKLRLEEIADALLHYPSDQENWRRLQHKLQQVPR